MHQGGKKHRSRTELMASVLEATAISMPEGELSTRIMYKSNTSQVELKKHLRDLSNFQLLERDSDSRRYRITGKGLRFLDIYNRMRSQLDSLD